MCSQWWVQPPTAQIPGIEWEQKRNGKRNKMEWNQLAKWNGTEWQNGMNLEYVK